MTSLPKFDIQVCCNTDRLPPEAEALFAPPLAESRQPLPDDRWDRDLWSFALIHAVTSSGHVLGGVYLDIGPIGGTGPLAREKLAYLERVLVRSEYRGQGLATGLLSVALRVAEEGGCLYVRCSNNWNNEAERRLLLKCGFALVDLDGESDDEPCYLAVRPLRTTRRHEFE